MIEQINNDLKDALKNGDKFRLSVLRMLKSALQLEAIKEKSEATDEIVLNVLKRQVKQRNDSIKEYTDLGKLEVAEDLQKEIDILKEYLPEEASDEDIRKTVEDAFSELSPSSMKDMGRIMKYVSEHLSNAEMSKVSAYLFLFIIKNIKNIIK